MYFSDGSALDHFIQRLLNRNIAGPDGLCQKKLLFLRHLKKLSGLVCIDRESFLTEYIFPMLQKKLHMGIMVRMGCCHIDEIHLRICCQLFVGTIGLRHSKFFSKALGLFQSSGPHCIELHISHLFHRVGHGMSNAAGT